MIVYLVFLIVLCVLCQPDLERMNVAFTYAALVVLHDQCFANLPGWWYYGTAGAFDAAIVLILARLPYSRLSMSLQYLCMASLLMNAAGWLMWFSCIDTHFYQIAYQGVYVAAIVILLRGSDAWGRCKIHLGLSGIPGVNTAYGCHGYSVSKEAGK